MNLFLVKAVDSQSIRLVKKSRLKKNPTEVLIDWNEVLRLDYAGSSKNTWFVVWLAGKSYYIDLSRSRIQDYYKLFTEALKRDLYKPISSGSSLDLMDSNFTIQFMIIIIFFIVFVIVSVISFLQGEPLVQIPIYGWVLGGILVIGAVFVRALNAKSYRLDSIHEEDIKISNKYQSLNIPFEELKVVEKDYPDLDRTITRFKALIETKKYTVSMSMNEQCLIYDKLVQENLID